VMKRIKNWINIYIFYTTLLWYSFEWASIRIHSFQIP